MSQSLVLLVCFMNPSPMLVPLPMLVVVLLSFFEFIYLIHRAIDLQPTQKRNEQLAAAQAKARSVSGDFDSSSHVEALRQEFEEQLIASRKELLQEIRQVEDKVTELKFRLNRLERKLA